MRYITRGIAIVVVLTLLIATSSTNSAPSSLQGETTIPNYATISGRFEIELMGANDVLSLNNELDMDVLGTVQQTPRYGVSGEAWVNGVWISSLFFDTTLSDRFFVKCTEEKAINMSSYVWVEWTAPVLEGDQELPPSDRTQDNFAGTILFKYGAESGSLQNTFDQVGGGDNPVARRIQIVSSHARSGTQSIELYQPPPPKTNADRRPLIKKFQNDFPVRYKEFYCSFWVLFPKEPPWTGTDPEGWSTSLGKPSLWFGPPESSHAYHINMPSWHVMKDSREIVAFFSWHKCFETERKDWLFHSGVFVDEHLEEWIHLQVYVKVTKGEDSVIRAWVNNKLIMDKKTWTDKVDGITVKCLDPSGYSQWNTYNCDWPSSNSDGFPRWCIELYDSQDSAEKRIFVDDIVWSTEKVPESYRVIGKQN